VRKPLFKIPTAVFVGLVTFIVTVFVVPCLPVQAAATPDCWAVIVGISDFQNLNNLRYADKNAHDVYDWLSPVWGEDHIQLLTNAQATKKNILDAIDWMAEQADVDDTVLFNFSGHGDDGGYFCPYDSDSTYSSLISAVELTKAFQPMQAEKIVVIMDSCFSGDFKDSLATDERVILMATSPDEVGWEVWALEHTVFTYYLLQALANFDKADTNHDYELSVEELFEYASPLTTEYEEDNDFESIQHPTLDDSYLGEIALLARFIFALNTMLPPGTNILTLDGVNYASVPLPLFWIPGSEHTLSVPRIVDTGSGTRYVFVNWDDGDTSYTRIVSKGSFTINYDKEQLLNIISSFSDPTGAGWYKDGSTASFSIISNIETPDTKHIFTGWSGDYTGTSSTGSLVMNMPKTVTANWRNEYLLSVNSAYGNPIGTGWYAEGSIADFSVTPYVETSDTRRYFTGWSGDLTSIAPSALVYMNMPKTVTANWRNEYLLTINSEYSSPIGGGWYEEGERANVSIEPVQGFLVRHIFTGWSGDLSVTQSSYSIAVDSPEVITATWRTDYVQLYVLIGVVVVIGVAIVITIALVRGKRVTF
jgi:hypothetical protein